ncbi:MAG: T9SS type A sorting domain-containing protein [Bacteroidota bacterium]
MKHFLLICLLWPFYGVLSQERPIAYLEYIWNPALIDWELTDEYRYQYDGNDSLSQQIHIRPAPPLAFNGTSWRTLTQFDDAGKTTYQLIQHKTGEEDWKGSKRYHWFTDEAGYYHWVTESWRETYWHLAQRRRIKEILQDSILFVDSYYENWREGRWNNHTHDSIYLDLEGREIKKLSYAWDGSSEWILITSWEHAYSPYGDKTYWRQNNHAQNPPNFLAQRWTYDYDLNGDAWEEMSERRNTFNPNWEILYRHKTRYDAQRRKLSDTRLYEGIQNSVNNFRKEYEYRDDTLLTRLFEYHSGWVGLSQKWEYPNPDLPPYHYYSRIDLLENGSWQLAEANQYEYSYDEKGLVNEITEHFFTPTFNEKRGYRRFFRNFNEAGAQTSVVEHYYDVLRASYVPYQKKVWVYPSKQEGSASVFSIYPQPTNGPFTVQFTRWLSPPVKVAVYDLQGKVLFSQSLDNQEQVWELTLSPPSQTAGLYLVRVFYEDGSSQTQKLQVF